MTATTSYRPATTCVKLLAFDRLVDHARDCQECRDRAGTGTRCDMFQVLLDDHNTTTCDCCPCNRAAC